MNGSHNDDSILDNSLVDYSAMSMSTPPPPTMNGSSNRSPGIDINMDDHNNNGMEVENDRDGIRSETTSTGATSGDDNNYFSDSTEDAGEFTKFTYTLEKATKKLEQGLKVTSTVFRTENGWPWRLGIHLNGWNEPKHVSCFVEMGDVDSSAYPKVYDNSLPFDRKATFRLNVMTTNGMLVSERFPRNSKRKDHRTSTWSSSVSNDIHFCGESAQNTFNVHKATDYGFQRFVEKNLFREQCIDPVTDSVTFQVEVRPDSSDPFDSKRAMGMVGLSNQGATCYLNSLLQTLYHTRLLRKAVYELDTYADKAEQGVALELQHLFAELQTKGSAVSTQNLTKAFGWTDSQVFTQHDVQELLRVMFDKLGERMKGTQQESIIDDLFKGQYATYVKCINVKCETSRVEDFYDIQLDVRGNRSVLESFRKYVQEERLDGENQYEAEGFGKQDALKGVKFLHLPPVLHLHLKRFAYNYNEDRTFKIHDRYEFPEILDLNEFVAKKDEGGDSASSSSSSAATVSSSPMKHGDVFTYRLHSVLVHSGNDQRGHYYAFVRLETEKSRKGKWVKFNDEFVSRVKRQAAVQDTFGTGPVIPANGLNIAGVKRLKQLDSNGGYLDSNASAYMLVYIKESEWDRIMHPVDSPPRLLLDRFDKDVKDKQLEKERMEKSRYRGTCKVATIQDVKAFHNFRPTKAKENDDWVCWDLCHELDYGDYRDATSKTLYLACAKELKVSIGAFRLWMTCSRQNDTVRLDRVLPYTPAGVDVPEKTERILTNDFNKKIYLEVIEPNEAIPRPNAISLFVREYDPSLPGIKPNSGVLLHTDCTLGENEAFDLWRVLAASVAQVPVSDFLAEYEMYEVQTTNFSFGTGKVTSNLKKLVDPEGHKLNDSGLYAFEPFGDIVIISRTPNPGEMSCTDFFRKEIYSVSFVCKDLDLYMAPPSVSKSIPGAAVVGNDDLVIGGEVQFSIVVDIEAHMQNTLLAALSEKVGSFDPKHIRLTFPDSIHVTRPEKSPIPESDYNETCLQALPGQRRPGKKSAPPLSAAPVTLYYELLPHSRELMTNHWLLRIVAHVPLATSGEPANGIVRKPSFTNSSSSSSSSSPISRFDQAVMCKVFVNKQKQNVTNSVLYDEIDKLVNHDGKQFELFCFVAAAGRIDRLLARGHDLDGNYLQHYSPHGVPMITSEGRAIVPEYKEHRIYCEVIPVEVSPPSARIFKIQVIHCTVKDENSTPTEFGVPSVVYVCEGDSLGAFWKRTLSRLNIPSEASQSWRPLLGLDSKLVYIDVRETPSSTLVPSQSASPSLLSSDMETQPTGEIPVANVFANARKTASKLPRVPQEDYDSLPFWSRPEIEQAVLNHVDASKFLAPNSEYLPSLSFFLRHSSSSAVPGRTGTPVHTLTIRSS